LQFLFFLEGGLSQVIRVLKDLGGTSNDDYALDSDYKNDLSFIFLLHLDEDACIAHSTTTVNNSEIVSNNSGEVDLSL